MARKTKGVVVVEGEPNAVTGEEWTAEEIQALHNKMDGCLTVQVRPSGGKELFYSGPETIEATWPAALGELPEWLKQA